MCNKCETLDDENHFFLNCKLNEHLRKAFLSDFNNINITNLLEIILNPTNIKQVKSLSSFIKQSLELRTGDTWFHLFYCVLNLFICCTLYVYVLLTIQCSHWPWLGWKLCLIKLKNNFNAKENTVVIMAVLQSKYSSHTCFNVYISITVTTEHHSLPRFDLLKRSLHGISYAKLTGGVMSQCSFLCVSFKTIFQLYARGWIKVQQL